MSIKIKSFFPSCTTSLNAGPILATVCWTCCTTTSNSMCSEQHVNSTLPPIFSFPLLLTWLPPLPPHPHQFLFRLERRWRSLVTLSSILHLFIWSLGSVFSFSHKFVVNVSSFVYPCGCCLNLGHHPLWIIAETSLLNHLFLSSFQFVFQFVVTQMILFKCTAVHVTHLNAFSGFPIETVFLRRDSKTPWAIPCCSSMDLISEPRKCRSSKTSSLQTPGTVHKCSPCLECPLSLFVF